MRRTRNITDRARKRPAQARSRETVRAILSAAAKVLVKRGYAGLTTNEVARKAGVSIGSLYEYFPHKDALVRELLDAHLAQAEAELEALDEAALTLALTLPLRVSVERLVHASFELHARDPALHRVLFEEAGRLPAVRTRAARFREQLVSLLTQLLGAHPEARVADAGLSARLVVQVVDALVHDWVTRPDHVLAERPVLTRELIQLVLGYCSPITAR